MKILAKTDLKSFAILCIIITIIYCKGGINMKKSAWKKISSGTLSAVMAFSAGASFALKTGAEWWDTPGHNSSGIRGDVNYSGKVDVFDLVDARSLLIAQFSGSSSPIDLNAADLD